MTRASKLQELAERGATEGERAAARSALERLKNKTLRVSITEHNSCHYTLETGGNVVEIKQGGNFLRRYWTAHVNGELKFTSIHKARVFQAFGLNPPTPARRIDIWA